MTNLAIITMAKLKSHCCGADLIGGIQCAACGADAGDQPLLESIRRVVEAHCSPLSLGLRQKIRRPHGRAQQFSEEKGYKALAPLEPTRDTAVVRTGSGVLKAEGIGAITALRGGAGRNNHRARGRCDSGLKWLSSALR